MFTVNQSPARLSDCCKHFLNYCNKRNLVCSLSRNDVPASNRQSSKVRCLSKATLINSPHLQSLSVRQFHRSKVWRSETVAFKLADIGEGIREVVIKEWYVKVGDTVSQFDNICEVQSDKASVTITSRFDGKITKLCHEVDATAIVGEPLIELSIDNSDNSTSIDKVDDQDLTIKDASPLSTSDEITKKSDENRHSNHGKILTTPAVRKMAIDHNINLADVTPTGRDGRILKEDVIAFIENISKKVPIKKTTNASSKTTSSHISPPGLDDHIRQYQPRSNETIVPIKGIQKAMFKTMTNSLSIPHFGLSDEIDLTKLVDLREELKLMNKNSSVRITYMPFFVKAASLALTEFPSLNSSIDENGENLIYKSQHNIGIAIDSPSGLIVANVKNVNNLSIKQIAAEMVRLQELANKNQLTTEDLSGATFTLSNIGSIGGLFGIPVIAAPQVSIGAIGKLRKVPRFDAQDNIIKAYVTTVLWTADHRVVDGATMCRFNNLWKQYLENPASMLTELK